MNSCSATVTVPAGTSWRRFHGEGRAAVEVRPQIATYDWIIDDQGPMDDADVAGMIETGSLFTKLSANVKAPMYTIVVTSDRFFGEWAKAIDAHYGNRRHLAAPSLEAAIRLADRLAAERLR